MLCVYTHVRNLPTGLNFTRSFLSPVVYSYILVFKPKKSIGPPLPSFLLNPVPSCKSIIIYTVATTIAYAFFNINTVKKSCPNAENEQKAANFSSCLMMLAAGVNSRKSDQKDCRIPGYEFSTSSLKTHTMHYSLLTHTSKQAEESAKNKVRIQQKCLMKSL